MSFSPELCPLCGRPNDCQLATKADCKDPCWCMKESFPPDLLARVPEETRRRACICKRCLAEARHEK